MQLEDKIVGFLTMRHLIICSIGFGIAYVIYISLAKTFYAEVWFPPILFISLLTLAVAFVEIKHIRFTKFTLLFLELLINPKKRMWDKRESTQFIFAGVQQQIQKETTGVVLGVPEETKATKLSHLEELTKSLNMMPILDEKKEDMMATVEDTHLANAAIHGDDLTQHLSQKYDTNG